MTYINTRKTLTNMFRTDMMRTVVKLCRSTKKNNGLAYDCIMDAWMLGFEQAYRAAKAGKLDFQQQQ